MSKNSDSSSIEKIIINDKYIIIIGSIFFGVVIPNATGLIYNPQYTLIQLTFSYDFFIAMAFAIWYGNRYILIRLQGKADWLNNPMKKVLYLVTSNIIYTSTVVTASIYLWNAIVNSGNTNWSLVLLNIVVCCVCVFFITHIYETFFLVKEKESGKIKEEQLERAKIQAELEALKNQIDPHFMFNSLNNLTHMIDTTPDLAKEYVENLADVYRYILRNKDKKLVLLEDEMIFFEKYISLWKLRFSDNLILKMNVSKQNYVEYLIPPASIMTAIENAFKHNEVSEENPLELNVELSGSNLIITNKINIKKSVRESSKIGLKNLQERYKIIIGKEVVYSLTDNLFTLILPMLKLGLNENINNRG